MGRREEGLTKLGESCTLVQAERGDSISGEPKMSEASVAVTCNKDCGGGCPLVAVVRDGRVTRVRNNPLGGRAMTGLSARVRDAAGRVCPGPHPEAAAAHGSARIGAVPGGRMAGGAGAGGPQAGRGAEPVRRRLDPGVGRFRLGPGSAAQHAAPDQALPGPAGRLHRDHRRLQLGGGRFRDADRAGHQPGRDRRRHGPALQAHHPVGRQRDGHAAGLRDRVPHPGGAPPGGGGDRRRSAPLGDGEQAGNALDPGSPRRRRGADDGGAACPAERRAGGPALRGGAQQRVRGAGAAHPGRRGRGGQDAGLGRGGLRHAGERSSASWRWPMAGRIPRP